MKNTALLVIVVVLAGLVPGDGLAEDAAGTTPPTAPAIWIMRYLDRNADQVIDRDELAAGERLADVLRTLPWQSCDADGDGEISLSELEKAVAQADDIQPSQTDDAEALAALTDATALNAVLDRLSAEERYAAEVAALRAAVDDLSDVDAVTTYVTRYPARFPHLVPVIHSWKRYYYHRPWRLHHLRRTRAAHAHRRAVRNHAGAKPGVKPAHRPAARPKPGAGAKKAARPHAGSGLRRGGGVARPHHTVRRGHR